MSILYKTNMMSWNFIVLAHWNNSPRVDMSLHLNYLSWFQANMSAFTPESLLAILFRAFGFLATTFKLLAFQSLEGSVVVMIVW